MKIKEMKNIIFITFAVVVALTLGSCEKVIDLDLNKDDPKFVIEGFVTKGETVHQVRITKTLNFDEDQAFPTVDNAVVIISDNAGNSETLSLVSPGLYQTSSLLGVEGRTYTISVTIGNETFTAQSYLPYQVAIDSLTTQNFSFGPDSFILLVANRLDPAGVANYYQFELKKNSERLNGIYIQDDQLSDGVEILQPVSFGDYEVGDTAEVTMYCIDQPVYKYFFALDQNGGGTNGATPANPESNFGTACLGYFSARTKETMVKIIE